MQAPVAYIVFNRPRHTKLTFAALRRAKPAELFVIADGPRASRIEDADNCAAVREIVTNVDWDCVVHRLYSDVNLGCKERVSSGLTEVFRRVERAIILEDDCLPHEDFFQYCDSLLERYAHDTRVSVITGNNFQRGCKRGTASYYFSKYNHCWGWATWRRAWDLYEGLIPFWAEWKNSEEWKQKCSDSVERRYWSAIFDRVMAGEIDSWDYPWTASVWHAGGLTATPNVNLVSNIGFGVESTHTASASSPLAEIPTEAMGEISHPTVVEQDRTADRRIFDEVLGGRHRRFPGALLRMPQRAANRILRDLRERLGSE